MTTNEDVRWESRLTYFELNEAWCLVDFLNWSIAYANSFGSKQDEHLLYKICLEKISLNPQLLKSCSSELVKKLVSNCINSFSKDIKSSEVKKFWDNNYQVLQTDFSEALSNTTRNTIQSALKRNFNEGEIIIDAGKNPFYVSEHGKDPKNATNQNGEDGLSNHKKAKKKTKNNSRSMIQKLRNSNENSSSQSPYETDEEIKFDFKSVETELLQEKTNEWEVGMINISQKFKKYQLEILEKARLTA
ncbi:17313_t:CDS:2 [Cetraspora pellucida]|uniref:17313_t:CDS:1 n=1 Tax=Cetraspora pellucida TaxID=1433469 RepID=A0A9N9NN52_9GLOM|nr:17313_t:CDS:2 [Cetraspora pellucida]